MSADQWIVVPNWEKFQHRDALRSLDGTTWIKNYTRLLHKQEYLDLTVSQRGCLHGLWLLYGITGEALTYAHARDQLTPKRGHDRRHWQAHIEQLVQAGFIELSASRPASRPASTSASEPASRERSLKDLPQTPNQAASKSKAFRQAVAMTRNAGWQYEAEAFHEELTKYELDDQERRDLGDLWVQLNAEATAHSNGPPIPNAEPPF